MTGPRDFQAMVGEGVGQLADRRMRPMLAVARSLFMVRTLFLLALLVAVPTTAAASPRDALTRTAFVERDKTAALAQIASAEAAAAAALAQSPDSQEALMTRAMATSYRAKLTRNRKDALSAKAQFDAIAAKYPRDAEAQAAVGAWHLNAVESLGGLVARGALGARKAIGLEATDRAIALGGDRALFPALAALLRLAIDPRDPRGAALAEAGSHGSTPTALDRALQRRAVQMVAVLKGGNARLIQALAKRLLPLGQFTK